MTIELTVDYDAKPEATKEGIDRTTAFNVFILLDNYHQIYNSVVKIVPELGGADDPTYVLCPAPNTKSGPDADKSSKYYIEINPKQGTAISPL